MQVDKSRKILCFQKASSPARRETLAGILQTANAHHIEAIVLPNVTTSNEIQALISRHKPMGCISNRNFIDDFIEGDPFRGTPTVFFGNNPYRKSSLALLIQDNATAIAQMAAQELFTLAPASYAYVGDASQSEWSLRRGEAFAKIIARTGKPFHLLESRTMHRTLTSVERPCGIFAANDMTASAIYSAAQRLRLKIPQDLAIISVDNDELLCTCLNPPLSSIQMDLGTCGRLAVEWLMVPHGKNIREYGPLIPVRRASTHLSNDIGPIAQKALSVISAQACSQSFSVDDVAAQLGFSRRYLDRLLREKLHQTALEAIHEVRFARIMTLLSRRDTPIGSIAEASGFRTQIALQKFFQRRMGISMRDWRREHKIVGFR